MTRINCGIKPCELSTKHIIAELREIKRIPNHIINNHDKLNMKNIPEKFTLGTGHVSFFYNKLTYLYNRYTLLYHEAKNIRNYKIENYSESFRNAMCLRSDLCNDYNEKVEDRNILITRLKERDYNFYKNLK